ncbi:MAG: hypothetical protein HYV28_07420 [Ignavibacteriales bacterium]|nr:hypothetical protein [Ignavibacteriales bacterium]
MKRIFILLLMFSFSVLQPQDKPRSFSLPGDKHGIAKISSEAPASNSINDILIVSDTVWIATSRGLSKSTDNGLNWTNFYGGSVFGTESVTALAYDSFTHTIWAATAHSIEVSGQDLPEGSGIRVSADGGSSWKTIPQPLDAATDTIEVYGINSLRALPVTVKVQNITYDLAITKNVIWAASFAGGLRKCRIDTLLVNSTAAWKRVVLPPDDLSSISPADSLDFCLSPVAGKYCANDNYNYRVFSLTVAHDSVLYVGTANGINKTTETRLAAASNDIRWQKFTFSNSSSKTISGNFVVAMEANDYTNMVYAATWKANGANEEYGISFTGDEGKTWSRALIDERVHNFGTHNNIAIALSDNGPYRSYDLGINWTTPGVITDNTTKITLRTDVFYSAAFSKNGQRLWLGSTEGLVSQDGAQPGWGNKWKLYIASQALTSKNDSYAYPNPFSPKTDILKIKYSTAGKTVPVTIRIFNFAMKYIATIIQNAQRGNTVHEVNKSVEGSNGVIDFWDGKDDNGTVVPNGVYFYRIDVESSDPMYGKILVMQ